MAELEGCCFVELEQGGLSGRRQDKNSSNSKITEVLAKGCCSEALRTPSKLVRKWFAVVANGNQEVYSTGAALGLQLVFAGRASATAEMIFLPFAGVALVHLCGHARILAAAAKSDGLGPGIGPWRLMPPESVRMIDRCEVTALFFPPREEQRFSILFFILTCSSNCLIFFLFP